MKSQNLFNRTLMRIQLKKFSLFLLLLLLFSNAEISIAQRGTPPPTSRATGFTLFGDVEASGGGPSEAKPLTFDLLLYSRSGVLLDRQKVGSKGRYRFLNVPRGDYDLVIEFENSEVARTPVRLVGPPTDFRQDLALQWRAGSSPAKPKAATISAEDVYERKVPNKDRFEKAQEAFDRKEYEKAVALFMQVVTNDPQDFQAWSELGTAYLFLKNWAEAEKAYIRAVDLRPKLFLALLNLGRLRIAEKNYQSAITPLALAIEVQPSSATANYYLGEAYLQIKKGSKAVGYLHEALKLDPIGMADAHLLLAALYNGAGMKDKAATEYEEFLKKKPDYPDKKKIQQYIIANRKQ
jgi:tetratricopeptide (TPR) repeat protein